ncbi:MAG TPA: DUF2946 family protein [Novosphingobium sp.]|nr:DUF2946 family protein [Novosphingobium sp.]
MRILIRTRRWLAITLIGLALAVRALLPQGYMPAAGPHVLSVQICADASGLPHLRQITLPARPPAHNGDHHQACAFAGHAMPLLGGADPLLLWAALLLAMAAALAPVAAALPARPARLRPPLRAPPLLS